MNFSNSTRIREPHRRFDIIVSRISRWIYYSPIEEKDSISRHIFCVVTKVTAEVGEIVYRSEISLLYNLNTNSDISYDHNPIKSSIESPSLILKS